MMKTLLKEADSKWLSPTCDIEKLKKGVNQEGLELSDASLRILSNRGFNTPKLIKEAILADVSDMHDPRLLKDGEKGADIIIEAIKNKTPIVIYGDYDADGVSAVSVGMISLKKLGADVNYWTNNRFKHGYGMNPAGLRDMLEKFPNTKLIITVDNGIASHEGIDMANDLGITTVVTDHHEAGKVLPNAAAVINPKRKDCTYPFSGLCGAGVIFKVMLLVYWRMNQDISPVLDTLDIVGMATVGDVVPLIDENRILVKEGLKRIESNDRKAFKVFRDVVGADRVTAHFTIAFQYVPMINALGRLKGDPKEAIDLFLTDNEGEIRKKVEHLKEINDSRKNLTVEQMTIAEDLVSSKGLKSVIVVYHESFHEGIVGLVAGRLKEKYHRPVFVFGQSEDDKTLAKGSGRSIDGFNLKESLDVLIKKITSLSGGGHAKAAGCSVSIEEIKEFEDMMIALADEKLTEDDFIKKIQVDHFFEPEEVTIDLVNELRELEPFGEAFPKPVLGVDGIDINRTFFMGAEKNHVKLASKHFDLIMWRGTESYLNLGEPNRIQALGYPEINAWNNRVSVQFIIDNNNLKRA